jgi:hypothetical protein
MMPCNTRQQTQVALEKADRVLLDAAMLSLGVRPEQYTYNGATVIVRGRALESNAIKVAYSQQVVQVTAKRYGWQLNAQKSTMAKAVYRRR